MVMWDNALWYSLALLLELSWKAYWLHILSYDRIRIEWSLKLRTRQKLLCRQIFIRSCIPRGQLAKKPICLLLCLGDSCFVVVSWELLPEWVSRSSLGSRCSTFQKKVNGEAAPFQLCIRFKAIYLKWTNG